MTHILFWCLDLPVGDVNWFSLFCPRPMPNVYQWVTFSGLVCVAPYCGFFCAHLQGLWPDRGVSQAPPSEPLPMPNLVCTGGSMDQPYLVHLLSWQEQWPLLTGLQPILVLNVGCFRPAWKRILLLNEACVEGPSLVPTSHKDLKQGVPEASLCTMRHLIWDQLLNHFWERESGLWLNSWQSSMRHWADCSFLLYGHLLTPVPS